MSKGSKRRPEDFAKLSDNWDKLFAAPQEPDYYYLVKFAPAGEQDVAFICTCYKYGSHAKISEEHFETESEKWKIIEKRFY